MSAVYTVRSGALHSRIELPRRATAKKVALIALSRECLDDMALALVMEVCGEQYRGDHRVYLATQTLLRELGIEWRAAA